MLMVMAQEFFVQSSMAMIILVTSVFSNFTPVEPLVVNFVSRIYS